MNNDTYERRLNPRIEVNDEMTYYTVSAEEASRGMLEDFSIGGARIWIEEALPTTSQLHFRVESDVGELSLEFIATLLHTLPRQDKNLYGYGCAIEETDISVN